MEEKEAEKEREENGNEEKEQERRRRRKTVDNKEAEEGRGGRSGKVEQRKKGWEAMEREKERAK